MSCKLHLINGFYIFDHHNLEKFILVYFQMNLAILQDRLLRALGQNTVSHGIASPFPQYVLPTAQQTAGRKITPAADHHGTHHGHQSMAGQGDSQTTSTSTANYYSQAQFYSPVSSTNSNQVPSYAPQSSSSVVASGPAHKGQLLVLNFNF